MATERLFVAGELPADVVEALAELQRRLGAGRPPVGWVAPEAMHLTLVFLGPTDAGLVPQIGAALRNALEQARAPLLRLGRPGAFPDARRPSVLWVGVEGQTTELGQLQAALVAALGPLGFPPERRRFQAHLTLGRVRRSAAAPELASLGDALRKLAAPPLAWRVRRVTLFRSQLLPAGPRYSALDTVELSV